MNSDSGLLTPVWTGTPAADLTADDAWWHAMLDVQVAPVDARAGLGAISDKAADVAEAAAVERIDLAAVALGARETGSPVVPPAEALTAEVARIDAARPGDLLDPAPYPGCADAYVDRARRRTTS